MGIDIKLIKELREKTGAGVLDAKKALESTGGDIEEAMGILREKGLAKAAKRSEREMLEGRIEARISQDGRAGLLVEVNCETDFVGTNEGFVAFVNDVADHLYAVAQEGQALEEVMELPFFKDQDTSPSKLLQDQMVATGENMVVRRFERYELGDLPGMIEVYVHPGNRVAVMLEASAETQAGVEQGLFGTLVHDLALHIAALSPICLTKEQVPGDILEAEKASYRKQALDEGKPEAIVERIVEGRLRKYYEGAVLFDQPFVKDDSVTIGELVNQQAKELGESITVQRFVRYELGQETD